MTPPNRAPYVEHRETRPVPTEPPTTYGTTPRTTTGGAPPVGPLSNAVPADDRPTQVNTLVVLLAVGAVLAIVAGLSYLAAGTPNAAEGAGDAVAGIGILLVLLGIFGAVVAWAVHAGQRWSWFGALGAAAVGILVGLVGIFQGETLVSILGIAVSAVVLGVLFNDRVQRWFGVSGMQPAERRRVA